MDRSDQSGLKQDSGTAERTAELPSVNVQIYTSAPNIWMCRKRNKMSPLTMNPLHVQILRRGGGRSQRRERDSGRRDFGTPGLGTEPPQLRGSASTCGGFTGLIRFCLFISTLYLFELSLNKHASRFCSGLSRFRSSGDHYVDIDILILIRSVWFNPANLPGLCRFNETVLRPGGLI